MKTLIGIWIVAHAQMSANDITLDFKNERMEIINSGYKVWSNDSASDSGLLTLYDGTNQMDMLGTEGPNKGKLFRCIWKREDEALVICYSQTDRPTTFETTEENNFVLIKWIKK